MAENSPQKSERTHKTLAPAVHDPTLKKHKDLRYREQFFPDAQDLVFDVIQKGFVPVPIILRKVLRSLTAPEVRVLLYLYLRTSRFGICYPTIEEMVHELGLTTKKNLLPHIRGLEEKRFISVKITPGRTFFLVHDPRVAIQQLCANGTIKEQDLFEINELYADLNQPPLTVEGKE